MRCTKCGKETNVVCLCGKCEECNGTTKEQKEEMKKEFDEFMRENKITPKW